MQIYNKYITNILHKHETYNRNKTSYNINIKHIIKSSAFATL